MSLYDRKLPTVTVDEPVRFPRPLCAACEQSTTSDTRLTGHTAESVWRALDEDRCPACRSHLVLRDREPLQLKCAIARRLLGLAPSVC